MAPNTRGKPDVQIPVSNILPIALIAHVLSDRADPRQAVDVYVCDEAGIIQITWLLII